MKRILNLFRPVRRRRRVDRDGVATVEAAICLPVIIILMMGTLEVCSAIYLGESLTVAAYEGCRVGVRRGASRENIRSRVEEALADRHITYPDDGSAISIEPADFSTLKALDQISVTLTVPTQGNSVYIFDTFLNRNVVETVAMVREFDE